MTLSEGTFQLYNRIDAPLDAGNWKLRVEQTMTATKDGETLHSDDLRVRAGEAFFTVRSPRFVLPPDQVLSTFPPANSEGSYGNRLPQVVIKRRTLPWERTVDDSDGKVEDPPWLALVLVADGEAEFVANAPVSDCFTPGLRLPNAEAAEVPVGNYLKIRTSMVEKIFPTQQDVGLLAHARAVDINDTELMMGDDDGYLSVVVSNRLPVAGRDPDGNAVPVRYLACLVNLEGQYTRLLAHSPDPVPTTPPVLVARQDYRYAAEADHARMGTAHPASGRAPADVASDIGDGPTTAAGTTAVVTDFHLTDAADATGFGRSGEWVVRDSGPSIYERMSGPWTVPGRFHDTDTDKPVDPTLRFPVLLHWSFTSYGKKTFKSLMNDLGSALIGSVEDRDTAEGRLPIDVVETGHIGLPHRTREGDTTTSWYRGPLLPHPPPPATDDTRIPLAHSSDQLRIVVPDHREDLSLATAFEIGRLLALSRPSVAAALMRWRADRFAVARRRLLLEEVNRSIEDALGRPVEVLPGNLPGHDFGYDVVFEFMQKAADNPEAAFGRPLPVHPPGRPLDVDGDPAEVLRTGLAVEVDLTAAQGGALVDALAAQDTPQPRFDLSELGTPAVRDVLRRSLDERVVRLTAEVNGIDPLTGRLGDLPNPEEPR